MTDTLSRRSRAQRGQHAAPPAEPLRGGWRLLGAIRSGVLSLLAVVGAICIIIFAIALIFGIRPVVVISGSMEPTLPVGSVVFEKPVPASQVQVGDIVTVQRPRNLGLITHRVKEITKINGTTALILKGDANKSQDPEPYGVRTAGKYLGHAVGLGYVTLFFQSKQGLVAGIGLAIFVIALFLLDPTKIQPRKAEPDEPGSP